MLGRIKRITISALPTHRAGPGRKGMVGECSWNEILSVATSAYYLCTKQ